jgi:hypothetical protein
MSSTEVFGGIYNYVMAGIAGALKIKNSTTNMHFHDLENLNNYTKLLHWLNIGIKCYQ